MRVGIVPLINPYQEIWDGRRIPPLRDPSPTSSPRLQTTPRPTYTCGSDDQTTTASSIRWDSTRTARGNLALLFPGPLEQLPTRISVTIPTIRDWWALD